MEKYAEEGIKKLIISDLEFPIFLTFSISLLKLKWSKKRGRRSLFRWVAIRVLGLMVLTAVVYTVSHLMKTFTRLARRTGKPLPVEVMRAEVRELLEAVGATSTTVPFHEVNLNTKCMSNLEYC